MERDWSFFVDCPTLPGEVVCVTGSCPELGEWNVNKLIQMNLDSASDSANESITFKRSGPGWTDRSNADVSNETNSNYLDSIERNIWSATVTIPDGVEVSYRFCVCIFVTSDGSDDSSQKVVVRRWETSLIPRRITCHEVCRPDRKICRFGLTPGSDDPHVQGGWLTNETVVQLKLQGSKAVNIWKKKHADKKLYVKVTPVETSQANLNTSSVDLDESLDISETRERKNKWPIVEVAKLIETDCTIRPQSQFGIEYNDEDFILFRAQMLQVPTVAFLVDIFGRPKSYHGDPDSENESAEHIGSCYVMPNHFKSTEGKIQATIVSNRLHPIGQFTTYFLVVQPMANAECDFSVSYANHWKPHWKGLDVGHRGLGNSYTKRESCATVRENTIGSMKNAASHGADMVEFDVQLSQDLIPVVYHDFELLASIVNKKGDRQMMVQMPLKNLTLEQLQQLKTYHPSEKSAGPKTFQQETDDDHQPFPSLELVLKTLDVHLGFNIELKWDMEHVNGSRESHNAFEMNLFVDTVMKTVMDHAGTRKIVFSSFNPDVCFAIRLKQNRYPVLFLTQGVHSKYDDYLDPRTRSVSNATYFASMAEILGVNAIAEDLLRDPSLVQLVKEKFKLVLFCWTDDQNDPSIVKQLKALGIDGVIYDRMDCNNGKEVKESVFLLDVKQLQQQQQSGSSSLCSCSPPSGSASPGLASILAGASVLNSGDSTLASILDSDFSSPSSGASPITSLGSPASPILPNSATSEAANEIPVHETGFTFTSRVATN